MKKVMALDEVALLAFSLAACKTTLTYYIGDLTLEVPSDWKMDEDAEEGNYLFLYSPYYNYSVTVFTSENYEDSSLE